MKNKFKRVMIFSSLVWFASNFHHPVTPSFFTDLNLPSHIFGTSYAVMVFTTFLTSPIWGSWGDKNSRINTLAISASLYGLSQIGLALSSSLSVILIFRAMAGVANGGFSVGLMAAIVDTSSEDKIDHNLANYTAVMSVSMALGFFVGGLLGYLPSKTVILFQGVMMILIGIGFKIIVGEINSNNKIKSNEKTLFAWDVIKNSKNSNSVLNKWLLIFLGITFFGAIGQSSNNQALNYYMKAQLGLKPIVNGVVKAITGIAGLIANLTINVWIIRKTNIKKSLLAIILLGTISALMIVLNTFFYAFLIWNILFITLYTIQLPILQSYAISRGSKDPGLMSGIFNAIKSLGAMFGAMVAGFIYDINSKLPFILTTIAFFIAFLFSVVNYMGKAKETN